VSANHGRVFSHWYDFVVSMEMIDVGGYMKANDYAHSRVMDKLSLLDI
jgi:hypothetical protein